MFVIKNKNIFVGISTLLIIISLFFIIFFGLKPSIEFKGGSSLEFSYLNKKPDIFTLKEKLNSLNLGNISLQALGEKNFVLKAKDLTEEERKKVFEVISFDDYKATIESFTSIGPSIGKELKQKSTLSIIFVIIALLLFIAYAFRKVSRPISSWHYGLITIITLGHDIIISIGAYALFTKFLGAEADVLFIVALLTILGLSVNDTIVVFDRIRENLKLNPGKLFNEIVGISINQTIIRSINTSLTLIFVLIALFLVGPVTTRFFALTLIVGMFIGTYSSICLSSPLLVILNEIREKNIKRKQSK